MAARCAVVVTPAWRRIEAQSSRSSQGACYKTLKKFQRPPGIDEMGVFEKALPDRRADDALIETLQRDAGAQNVPLFPLRWRTTKRSPDS